MALVALSGGLAPEQTLDNRDLGHLSHEPDLMSKIMLKRRAELDRRAKLFDPRTRQLGVPHAVLRDQIREKKMCADAEASEEAFHARNMLMQDHIANAIDHEKEQRRRGFEKEARDYSLLHLTMNKRKEFPISDPNLLKKELPARISDDDDRLGVSSLQIFTGEDIHHEQKQKAKKQLQKDWLLEQMMTNEKTRLAQREEDRRYENALLGANEVRTVCEQYINESQLQQRLDVAAHNLRTSETKAAQRKYDAQQEHEAILQHVENVRSSDRMRESLDHQRGIDSRLLRQEYKRLTVEQEAGVYEANAQILLDKDRRMNAERAEDARHAYNTFVATHVLHTIEEENGRQRANMYKEMVKENKIKAEMKRVKDLQDRKVYRSFDVDL